MTTIERLPVPPVLLGENPLWDDRSEHLYWVDAIGRTLFRADAQGAERQSWTFHEEIGSLVLREQGGGIIALGTELHTIDLETGATTLIADLEAGIDGVRLNDAKVAPSGALVIGSLDSGFYQSTLPLAERTARGGCFRLDPDHSAARIGGGYAVFNGPCWSPDGSLFYHSDTLRSVTYVSAWDAASGTFGERRVFLSGSMADGATIDTQGYHWSAFLGTSEVRRHAPDGTLAATITLPERLVTSVSFGGPALDILFVTAASTTPYAGGTPGGGVFAVTGTGCFGMPAQRFAG